MKEGDVRSLGGILGIALAGAALSLLCWHFGLFTRAEYVTWDWRMRAVASPNRHSDDIVIVAVDQKTLDSLDEENALYWPFPRDVYASVVDFCARAGCAGLVFDMYFTEPSNCGTGGERALGQTLARYGKATLAAGFDNEEGKYASLPPWASAPPLRISPEDLAAFPTARNATLPIMDIAAHARVGNVKIPPDSDGAHRRIPLISVMEGKPIPALALAGFLTAMGGAQAKLEGSELRLFGTDGAWEKRIPLDENGKAILRFRGNRGSYAFKNAADVMRSELRLQEGRESLIQPEEFAGKYVLFGVTAPGLFDRASSPMEGFLSGVELNATILDNVLSDAFIKPVPVMMTIIPLMVLLPSLLSLAFWPKVTVAAKMSGWLSEKQLPPWTALLGVYGLVWGAGVLLPPGIAFWTAHQGYYLPLVPVSAACFLALLGNNVYAYAQRLWQKRHIEKAFKNYLAPAVVDRIVASGKDVNFKGVSENVTIFFSDIEDFSALSADQTPEWVVSLLNAYFEPMTDTIIKHEGTLDKFIGDSLMAYWNAPEPVTDHEGKALAAAMEMQAALATLNEKFEKEFQCRLVSRIGLHTGKVHVGNMGANTLADYTIIGNSVNLAKRLEGLGKDYGMQLVVSEAVQRACNRRYLFQRIGICRVKGPSEPVAVYTVYGLERKAELGQELEKWAKALERFDKRDFKEALQMITDLNEEHEKTLYKNYITFCEDYIQWPPPDNWDRVLPPAT